MEPRMTTSRAIRCLFFAYWAALTFLLLVYNPFEWVPIDEELVEKNFGIGLDPHTGTFFLLGLLAWVSRFARPWWVLLGLIAYGGLVLEQGRKRKNGKRENELTGEPKERRKPPVGTEGNLNDQRKLQWTYFRI